MTGAELQAAPPGRGIEWLPRTARAAPRILTLLDHYLPGSKYGGISRSISNLADELGDRFEFWIVTRDRDWGESRPYADVPQNAWTQVGKAKVYYATNDSVTLSGLRRLLKRFAAEVEPDAVFLNGMFERLTIKALALRRLGFNPGVPFILAPRGQLTPASLSLKARKKHLYLSLTRAAGLYRGLVWQAASPLEQEGVERFAGAGCRVHVAPNIPARPGAAADCPRKAEGEARFVFLSRLTPVKNLHFLLNLLPTLEGSVALDIYGHVDDESYWQQCQSLMARMPGHVKVTYRGPLAQEDVIGTISRYQFFVLPTLGENYGHTIVEALLAGRPVVIGDETPWRGLEAKGAGWDIALDEPGRWGQVLQGCVGMNGETYRGLVASTVEFARAWAASSGAGEQNVALFRNALSSGVTAAGRPLTT